MHFALFEFPIRLVLILIAISSLYGFKNKLILKIGFAVIFIFQIIDIINVGYIRYPIEVLPDTIFYIALLIFSLNNRIPSIILPIRVKKLANKGKYEEAFNLLKEEYEAGFISGEEYQIRRKEILKKL